MNVKNFLSTSMLAIGLSLGAAIAQDAPSVTSTPGLLRDRPLAELAHWDRPAAADSRSSSDYEDNYANDTGDAFFFAPGVWVNALDLSEPRIVMRGYALGNRQERATVTMLRDGAPLTDVHGQTNTAEIDLLSISEIDVFRGGGGDLRFSGDNLGGAINFVSPTGRTARYGRTLRFDAGSSIEGTPAGQANASYAAVTGALDYYASITGRFETGHRDNAQRLDTHFNANLGYEFSSGFTTRFFVEALRSDMELAGGLLLADLEDDPSQAMGAISLGPLFPGGPLISLADGAEEDEHGRNLMTARIANATAFSLLGVDFDAGLHYVRRDLEAPQIDYIGVIDENGTEWGASLTASRAFALFGMETRLRLGGDYATGSKSSNRFENLDGEPDDALFLTDQKSKRLTGFVEAATNPFRKLLISVGAKFIQVKRSLSVDDDDDQRTFTGVAAQGGVMYELSKSIQIFANAARSYEPPSMSELTSDNPEDLNGLDEQDSFSYEAGLRGRINDWIGWDITYFNANIENEIINIEEPETNGLGGLFVNADTTTHRGVEAGVDISLFPSRFSRKGHALTLRNVYNYNDFRFVDSGSLNVDGNRLAGAPQHVYRGELRYASEGSWFAALNVQMAAGDYFADHENETSAPTYSLVGFSAGWRMGDNLELFASGENLTNQKYAAGLTPVLSQEDQAGRIFTPGAGASVYGGFRYRF